MSKPPATLDIKQAWQSCYYCPMETFRRSEEFVKYVINKYLVLCCNLNIVTPN